MKKVYSFVSEGSKLTKEISDFFKGTARDRIGSVINIDSYYVIKAI